MYRIQAMRTQRISIPHKPSRSLLQSTILWWLPAICLTWFKWNLNFSFSANKPYNKIHCYHLDFDTHHLQPKNHGTIYKVLFIHIHNTRFQMFLHTTKIIHPYRKCHLSIFTKLVQIFQNYNIWCFLKLMSSGWFVNDLSWSKKSPVICVTSRHKWHKFVTTVLTPVWLCLPYSYKMATFLWHCGADAIKA